jgi:hypothetical protein
VRQNNEIRIKETLRIHNFIIFGKKNKFSSKQAPSDFRQTHSLTTEFVHNVFIAQAPGTYIIKLITAVI